MHGVEHAADDVASWGGGVVGDILDAGEHGLIDDRKGLRKMPDVEQGCYRDYEQSENVN